MLGGSRPGPVNRYGFEIAGRAGARLAPIKGLAPAGWPLSGWRPAPRKRKTADGWTRDVLRALERRAPGPSALGGAAHSRTRGRGGESFSKIVLASPSEFPYSTSSHGGVAQLGERLTGSQEVRGSIPLVSTIVNAKAFGISKAFFHAKIPRATNHFHTNKKLHNLFPMSVHSLLDNRNYQCSSLPLFDFRNASNYRQHPNNLRQRKQLPKTTPFSTSNERYVVQRSPNQFH